MPNKVKLLNAAPGGTTGTGYKVGTGKPPYTLRVFNGVTTAGAGKGVTIQSSNDSTDGTDGTWQQEVGVVGGKNYTEVATAPQDLVDLPDGTIVKLDHECKWLRGVTGSVTTVATLTLEILNP